jgi:ketosteroid isomerase-like protein
MSQKNVEIVRRSIAAFNAGDLEAALVNVHPDVEWLTNPAAPDMGLFQGHDGLRRLAAMLKEVLGEVRMDADEFLDARDHVVVLGRLHVIGASSGAATDSYRAWVYTLRAGDIIRQLTFVERAQALEAAGLSEQDTHSDSP